MNEAGPGAAPVESTLLPMPYEDRSAGLVVFGILTILVGCLAGLLIPSMLFARATSAKALGGAVALPTIVTVILTYGVLAAALVWLGIGSMMARRWARALLLIFFWSWLIMGFFLIFRVFFLPKELATAPSAGTPGHPAMHPGAMSVMAVVMLVMCDFFFVLLPAAVWTLFYNSRHVKATCEARDPVTRWTDACPLPVLGFCLWLMSSALTMLTSPIASRGVTPFFGTFLTGIPGTMLCVAVAAIWSYAALSLYKLEQRGWWLILIAYCVWMASYLLTFCAA